MRVAFARDIGHREGHSRAEGETAPGFFIAYRRHAVTLVL